jgi:cell division protein FtsB
VAAVVVSDRRPNPTLALGRKLLRGLFWFLAVSLAFNSLFGDMGVIQGLRQRGLLGRLRREVADLRQQNARLIADIQSLRQDPYRIETIAREELGLSRPGEIIFLFQGPDASPALPGAPESPGHAPGDAPGGTDDPRR